MKQIFLLFIIFDVTIKTHTGIASFYSDKFNGRKTANGEIYKKNKMTGASNIFKFGDTVLVTNLSNNKSVKVRINDRIGHSGRIIDLSRIAADSLDFINKGTTKVKVELIK